MTEDRPDFERDLERALASHAPPPGRHVLERALSEIARTPQRGARFAWLTDTFASVEWSRAGAMVAVAAVALVVGISIGRATDPLASELSPPPTQSMAPSQQPTRPPSSEPTTDPNAAAPYGEWVRVELPDPAPGVFGGGTPSSVVAFGGGYVAVGTIFTECCAEADPAANAGVVWTSADGQTWEILAAGLTFEHATLAEIVTDGERLLITGTYAEPEADAPGFPRPAMWVSTDGEVWQRVPGDWVPSVVRFHPDGRIIGPAIGHALSNGTPYSTFQESSDGLSWTEISANWAGEALDLVVAPNGRAVAVGTFPPVMPAPGDGQLPRAIVYTSEDGRMWPRPKGVEGGARLTSVAYANDTFLAVGTVESSRPDGSFLSDDAVWTSSDGADWARVADLTGVGDTARRVYATGDLFVVVGDTYPGGLMNARVWVSPDGHDWAQVPDQDAFSGQNNEIMSVIESDDGLLAVGRRWDAESGHPIPVAWLASP